MAERDRDALLVEELEQLTDEAARESVLEKHRASLLRSDFVDRLAAEVFSKARTDSAAALSLARASVRIAEGLGEERALAISWRTLGNALYANEAYSDAVESYERAVRGFETIGDRLETARTLSTSLQSLILLGRYDAAEQAADQARGIFEELGERLRLARLEINVGNLYHRQDRFREALALYERAYRELVGSDEPAAMEGVAAALSNIAGCLIMLNEFPRALDFYREARAACEAQGMTRLVAQADYNISYMFYLRGEYSRSIEMLNAARQNFIETSDAYHTALCDMDQAEIYLDLNLSSEAARLARRARKGFGKIGTGYEAAKSLALEAIATANLGSIYRALGLFTKARDSFEREQNSIWPSVIDLYRATVLLEEGRLFEAHRFARGALAVFESAGLDGKSLVTRLLLAELALKIGDLRGAREQAERALQQSKEMDSPLPLYQALFLRGRVEESAGDVASAYESYEEAAAILESLRSSLQREEMKVAFMKNRLGVYEALVDLTLQREDGEISDAKVLEFIERAKARGLIDLILGSIRGRPGLGAGESDLARKVQFLREELNWYYRRIEHEQLGRDGFNPDRVEKLSRTAKARENELLDALRELPALEGAHSGFRQNKPVSLERIRASLGPERALVEYFVARGRLYACVLGEGGFVVTPIAVADHVRDLVRRLQFQLSRFQLPAEHVETIRRSVEESTMVHLNELHESLIAPIASQIAGRDLVIVPHGFTHYVPFHALFDGSRYLVDDFTISYAPSASVFVHCLEAPEPPGGDSRSLVLGISDENAPFILEEVHSVAASLPRAELLLDEEASLPALREMGPGRRVLHVATHGYFRQDNPLFSAIRLHDFYLSLYDLYELRLPVELAAISACATGLSAVVEGDEILGLVRGLLYAGARSLLVSLWDVQDRATASLMQSFYTHLSSGMDRAAALRCAMLEQRKHTPQPFFWAPYLVVGRVGPL